MLPIEYESFKVTPWTMYGILGKNALEGLKRLLTDYMYHREGKTYAGNAPWQLMDSDLPFGLLPYNSRYGRIGGTDKAYGSLFWAGLPVAITAFDPFNIEFDINYGYVDKMGRYEVTKK